MKQAIFLSDNDKTRVHDRIIPRPHHFIWTMLLMIGSTVRISGVYAFASNNHRIQKAFRCGSFRPAVTLKATFSQKIESILQPTAFEEWLDMDLPEGRCVGVAIKEPGAHEMITPACLADPNHWAHSRFHPDELSYGMNLSAARSNSFLLGRLSMRLALDFPDYPILKDSYGRPLLAPGVYGSITHKDNVGIALVSELSDTAGVGVDLEFTSRPGKRSIAKRVLTDNEKQALGNIPGITGEEEVMLRFRYA
jgi:hypothetical protein